MGYEVERFVKQVDEHLICPLCKKVFKDPTNCPEGHTFCKVCIDGWLQRPENYNTCPKDQKVHVIDKQALSRNYALCGVINNLEVFCHIPHELKTVTSDPDVIAGAVQQTCDWTGKLQSLENHRETCPFQQVQCSNVNCNRIMQRRELKDHDERCNLRNVRCVECHFFLIEHELERHKENDCPETLVPCPNQCTNIIGQVEKIKRKNTESHIINICSKAVLDCPYKDQECSVKVERQDVEKHVQENIAAHMILLAKECSFFTKQNSSLTVQNSSLAEQCSSLTKKCSALTEQCSALTEQCSALTEQCSALAKEVKAQLSSTNTYTWVIYDFPALCDKHPNGSHFTSPIFWLRGYKLSLKIYPNGFDTDVSELISLYLNVHEEYPDTPRRVTKVPNSESAIKFRLSMMSQKPDTQDVSFSTTYVFKKSEGFGWQKFIKTTDALSAAYCNRTNGSLTIKCTIVLDKP